MCLMFGLLFGALNFFKNCQLIIFIWHFPFSFDVLQFVDHPQAAVLMLTAFAPDFVAYAEDSIFVHELT